MEFSVITRAADFARSHFDGMRHHPHLTRIGGNGNCDVVFVVDILQALSFEQATFVFQDRAGQRRNETSAVVVVFILDTGRFESDI